MRKLITIINDIEQSKTYRNNDTQNIWAKTLRDDEPTAVLKPAEKVNPFNLD